MDHMLYVVMSGASQTMLAQAANTHNLANVNTTGFRADLAAFQSVPLTGPGLPSRIYAQAQGNGVDLTPGAILSTGRELDIAVNGPGWIAVQAADGAEAYTRAGDLRVSANGFLETATGQKVLGNGGPIALPPAEKMEIGADGTISIRPLGQDVATLAVVDRIKLVAPPAENLMKRADGLLGLQDGEVAAPDASVRILTGSLESSNVNAVEAMVNMITLARQFEMQVKMMQTAQNNDAAATQMMQMS
ncbi:MAG: flagellar basal-body rod protein FlgF [Pseudomonadota bacterium]